MLARNDQPYMGSFNFATDSIFNNMSDKNATTIPILQNDFLLLDMSFFLLLDGTPMLTLGA